MKSTEPPRRKRWTKLGFKAHPHMLRHACSDKLANDGHDTRALQAYLGHKNIQHTVRYTELASGRFNAPRRRDHLQRSDRQARSIAREL
jgi:site-specific recombinase XerD